MIPAASEISPARALDALQQTFWLFRAHVATLAVARRMSRRVVCGGRCLREHRMSVIAHVGLSPRDFIDWVMLYDVLGGQGC